MTWGFKERRKFPRATFTCKIVVALTGQTLIAQTKNISAGGVRIAIEERLNQSDTIDLELFPTKEKSIKCKGRVCWATEIINPMESIASMFDVGVEFMDISDTDREYIKEMVDKLLSTNENAGSE